MSELLQKATLVYDYLKEKPFVKTYMTYKPVKTLTVRHINGLGFKTTKQKKDLRINLDPKETDWRCKLILAYYSMNLIPAFLLEGCMCTVIKSAFSSGSFSIGKPVEIDPLLRVLRMYADLFKNETLTAVDASKETILQRVNYFVDLGALEISNDS